MKDYKNYIFDLYGTLVDIHTDEWTAELWEKLSFFYGFYGAMYEPEELKESYSAMVAQEENNYAQEAYPEIELEYVFQKLFEKKGVKADMELAVHAGQFFRILSMEYVKVYDGTKEMLELLHKKGKKVYLLSNAQDIFTSYELRYLGLTPYFDDIFISSSCQCKKPDTKFYQMLIDKHQLNIEECLMIGNDNTTDIAGAKELGMDSLYIHSNLSPELKGEPDSTYFLEEMDMKKLMEML
ncbi:HAD family hydrolase [Roseburia sp. 499]|uniref:HAD family hydrolase n=1 Tax=Roseburia sp. 499 TaxID=1261634 RepID=UPI0009531246|nr:HAD family hydrolase [Roseburia sp. 499]WVK69721.1 HAD family hydrolase [Roseburia sp. 499]